MTGNSQSLDNQAMVKLLDNYVNTYGEQHKKEKAKFTNSAAVGNSQNYEMLKKLSAILANKALRQHILK